MAALTFSSSARGTPELRAEVHWHGKCDDAADLTRQVQERGAELLRPESPSATTPPLRVEVSVSEDAPDALSAEIALFSGDGRDTRRVRARECSKLRSAVAWLLVILAQQRPARAEHAAPASSVAFPDGPAPEPASPPGAVPQREHEAAPRRSTPADVQAPARKLKHEWAFGWSMSAGLGLVSAPALGPLLFGRYRPPVRWLPTVQLSLLQLATVGYEPDGTAISLTRRAARTGAWLPLPLDGLELGLAVELGQLEAEGSGAQLSRGRRDAALWFALAAPARFSLPLIAKTLAAELELELDYAPVPYTFRYAGGAVLASTRSFEGRGQIGLACRW